MGKKNEKKEVFVGIDIHRDYGRACIQNSQGFVLDEFNFSNNPQGFKSILDMLSGYDTVHAAIESTGNLWNAIWYSLEKGGVDLHLVHTTTTRAIATNKFKNDKLSARTLAMMLRGDFLACSYVPPREIRAEREIVRLRASLVKMRTQVKNKVRSVLHKYNVEVSGTVIFGEKGMIFIEGLSLDFADQVVLSSLLNVIRTLDREIEAVDGEIAKASSECKDALLMMTVPGIGYYSASMLHSEIGEITRFPDDGHLASWIGLVPSMHQSGDVQYYGPITKRGSKRLRCVLVQCARAAVRSSPKIRAFYERIAGRRGEQKAIIAVARKLVKIIYAVLTEREPSHYGDKKKTEMKMKKMMRKVRRYDLPEKMDRVRLMECLNEG